MRFLFCLLLSSVVTTESVFKLVDTFPFVQLKEVTWFAYQITLCCPMSPRMNFCHYFEFHVRYLDVTAPRKFEKLGQTDPSCEYTQAKNYVGDHEIFLILYHNCTTQLHGDSMGYELVHQPHREESTVNLLNKGSLRLELNFQKPKSSWWPWG